MEKLQAPSTGYYIGLVLFFVRTGGFYLCEGTGGLLSDFSD